MEPQRSSEPVIYGEGECGGRYKGLNFLQAVRKLCNENDIIMIVDEVTSGFRLSLGGWHQSESINCIPDVAVFGKGLSNGYALGAVIGKKEVMEAAQGSFISSTYFTEDVGFTAALACL